MSAFISLGHAARLLADGSTDGEDLAVWQALLIARADELHAIKTWADHSGSGLPGGISYQRNPEHWRIPTASFRAWCEMQSYVISSNGGPKLPAVEDQGRDEAQGRRAKQITEILAHVQAQGWDALRIPKGGKQSIKTYCLKNAALFTETGFDHAWRSAIATERLRMADHDTYARRYGE